MSTLRDNDELEGCCCNFVQCPYVSSTNITKKNVHSLFPQCRTTYRNPYPISRINEILEQENPHHLINREACMLF